MKIKVLTPKKLTKKIIKSYEKEYEDTKLPVTVTALSTGKNFINFVNGFQEYVSEPNNFNIILNTVKKTENNNGVMCNMLEFLSTCNDPALKKLWNNNNFIVASYNVNTSIKGLSIFLPESNKVYNKYIDKYRRTKFAKEYPDGWQCMLNSLFEK